MAAKFVVLVALFAACGSNPVLINGVLYRDGRAYSISQAYNYGGGMSTAQANVNGNAAQAYGSSSGDAHLARDGHYYPGQAIAQAQTYDAPNSPAYGAAKAVAQTHNGAYFPLPAPATVITYEQNFATPEVAYQDPGAVTAQSSAIMNEISDSSISSASSNDGGIAESSAKTAGHGSYETTSSNAKTHGPGSANSNANSGFGATSTSAKSQGQGSASSVAQTNGAVYPVPVVPVVSADPVQAPAVIDAKTPIFYTPYVPVAPAQEVATSNANVIGSGSAASSAKITHGRTIGWRFGTMYDAPAAAHAQANTHSGYGAAKSTAHTHGYGSSSAQSSANANGAGSANANANVNSAGHGAAKAASNTQYGTAASSANINSGYGNAKSTADVHGLYYGGSRTSADAHSQGSGNAASFARTQGVNTAYRVASSQANTSGYGSAHAQTA